jgi:hypothetical protein
MTDTTRGILLAVLVDRLAAIDRELVARARDGREGLIPLARERGLVRRALASGQMTGGV